MKGNVVVFDFDKTLTQQDTILGFLNAVTNKPFKVVRSGVFLFFAVLHKLKIISNASLKQKGVDIFLKGMDKDELDKRAEIFASSIKFSDIYYNEFCKKYPQAIIATASYYNYLKPIFPGNKIICSHLLYENNHVTSLINNAFGAQKASQLVKEGISNVDIFYTDSINDQSVMDMSDVVYLVKKDKITKIKG